jgi:tRNA1(Val) A37 N6-methylase TrmN6
MSDTTIDDMLGGKVRITQPARGYRAGTDAVLLAATIPTNAAGHALDVGCGVGAIGLLAMGRVKQLKMTGLEQDGFVADLARQNLADNQFSNRAVILHGDLFSNDHGLEVESFDRVITNPPYFSRQHHQSDDYRVRARTLPENITLAQWAYQSLLLVRHGGWLHMVLPAQDLSEILVMMDGRAGNILCKPVLPKSGQPANRILLAARRNAKGPFQLLSPLVMHEHDGSYSAQSEAIARDGEMLEDFAKLC